MPTLRQHPLREAPIDFKPPADPAMQPPFGQAGLALEGIGGKTRARIRKLQDELAYVGGLFAMYRPTFRPSLIPYYHRDYTAAALEGAPPLPSLYDADEWLPGIKAYLQDFARQPAAKEIVGLGLATHYNRIAALAERVPRISDRILLRANQRDDGVSPLHAFGVNPGSVAIPEAHFHKDRQNRHWAYVDLEAVASRVSWIIPDFNNADTGEAIHSAFTETRASGWVADPERLFRLSRIVVERGLDVSAAEVYGS